MRLWEQLLKDGKRGLAGVKSGNAKSLWVLLYKKIAQKLLDDRLGLSLNDYGAHNTHYDGAVRVYSLGLNCRRLESRYHSSAADVLGDGGSPEIGTKVVLSLRRHPCESILMALVGGCSIVIHG